MKRFVAALLVLNALSNVCEAQSPAPLPRSRGRLLGVFNAQTGDPIEGAEVLDVLNKTKAMTTATGTVTLSFLPDGGSMVRVQKIGFAPYANVVAISEADTVPVTVMLTPVAQTLPTVLTKEAARPYTSPALRDFEERRLRGEGRFIGEDLLRKNDSRRMTDLIRQIGVSVQCAKTFPYACFAVSSRQGSRSALRGGGCSFDVYIDGLRISDERRDLEKIRISEIGGVEVYSGPATIPPLYNMTGSTCGVVLFWSRER